MDSVNPDYEAIAAWFALQSDNVQKNAAIVDADVVGQPFMLHIDKNTPEVFTPRMPPSADSREDGTCPRITVSPSLWACYVGYNRAHQDYLKGSGNPDKADDAFRGGSEICEQPFTHCLKVNKHLVPDAEKSQEHWLVAYTDETREYKPTHVGKVFVSRMISEARSGEKPTVQVTLYIQVEKKEGFKFSATQHLDWGWWKATCVWGKLDLPYSDREGGIQLEQIDEKQWVAAKNQSAALLSHVEPVGRKPAWAGW